MLRIVSACALLWGIVSFGGHASASDCSCACSRGSSQAGISSSANAAVVEAVAATGQPGFATGQLGFATGQPGFEPGGAASAPAADRTRVGWEEVPALSDARLPIPFEPHARWCVGDESRCQPGQSPVGLTLESASFSVLAAAAFDLPTATMSGEIVWLIASTGARVGVRSRIERPPSLG